MAAAGVFSLLLVHPISDREENRWMRTYARGFYLAMLPAIAMLWLAVGQRVGQYGLTERRYFLLALSSWLAGIAIYFAWTRSRDIRIIPATLGLGALLTFAGPWSAYHMSEASQVRRLETLLTDAGVLADGAVRRLDVEVPPETSREVSAVVRYLESTHGTDRVAHLLPPSSDTDRDAVPEDLSVEARAEGFVTALGFPYVGPWAPSDAGAFSYFTAWSEATVDISGYDVATQADDLHRESAALAHGLIIRFDSATANLVLELPDGTSDRVPLAPLLDRAEEAQRTTGERVTPIDAMVLEAAPGTARILIVVSRVRGLRGEAGIELYDLDLRLFIRPGAPSAP